MRAKTPTEIDIMREGGGKLAEILRTLSEKVEVGVLPTDIAKIASREIKKQGMQAVVLGYEGFPDVMCISVNSNIVHGVPQKDPFKQGDIVKLDLTLGYKGLVLDSAITTVAGELKNPDAKRLIEGTRKSLEAGIAAIKGDGTRVGDISAAVQDTLQSFQLGIIRELVGHGVGYGIHEDPNIPNYGVAGTGPVLSSGMTIAIEPMASLGDWKIEVLRDGQTIAMADRSLGAHFEHTVLITEDGSEILTSV